MLLVVLMRRRYPDRRHPRPDFRPFLAAGPRMRFEPPARGQTIGCGICQGLGRSDRRVATASRR